MSSDLAVVKPIWWNGIWSHSFQTTESIDYGKFQFCIDNSLNVILNCVFDLIHYSGLIKSYPRDFMPNPQSKHFICHDFAHQNVQHYWCWNTNLTKSRTIGGRNSINMRRILFLRSDFSGIKTLHNFFSHQYTHRIMNY